MKKIKKTLTILISIYVLILLTMYYKNVIIAKCLTQVTYYENIGNYKKAKNILNIAKILNNSDLYIKLAEIKQNDKYGKPNKDKAIKYLKQALAMNNYKSAYNLYIIYLNIDSTIAFNYLLTYINNYDKVIYSDYIALADMYINGIGTKVNINEGLINYEKSLYINNDNSELHLKIANLYLLEKDFINIAMKHFTQSALLKNSTAKYNLGVLYFEGKYLDQDLSESEEWFIAAYKAGSAEAALTLGINYKDGLFGERSDYSKALFYFNEAVALNNIKAKYFLAEMFYKGYGVPQDTKMGKKILNELIGTEYETLATIKFLTFSGEDETKQIIRNALNDLDINEDTNEDTDNQKATIEFERLIDNKKNKIFIKIEPELKIQ